MRGPGKCGRFFLLLLGLVLVLPSATYGQTPPPTLSPVSGRALSAEEIIPADVLARLQLLREELELIRFEMGAPKVERSEIAVSEVVPRQVFFQAVTLFRKANQLNFELTGDPGPELRLRLPRAIRPFDVWRVVDAAYGRILAVKEKFGILDVREEKLEEATVRPTEVFRAILQTNRQLDLLLRQPPSTRDVFQQVALATQLASHLLIQFPGATPMPAAPAFERGKRPAEVYRRLLQCYARVRAIAEHSGMEALKLEMSEAGAVDPATIKPGHVYDIAILIVSELAYLHAQLESSEMPAVAYAPGLKLPAHVYQRAGQLLQQLGELEERVAEHPDWLTRTPGISRQP